MHLVSPWDHLCCQTYQGIVYMAEKISHCAYNIFFIHHFVDWHVELML